MLAGKPEITGASSSVTVTVKVAAVEFPWMSVAVYATVVVPTGKVSPEAASPTIESIPQLSAAVGAVQFTTALQFPASLVWVMSVGMSEITGASSSVSVTVKLEVVVLPAMSVAVNVTVVMPTANVSPLEWVLVNAAEQLSLAVGSVHVTAALQVPPAADCVMLAGVPLKVGAMLSCTVTVKVTVAVLLLTSVAEKTTSLSPRSSQSNPDWLTVMAAMPHGSLEPLSA